MVKGQLITSGLPDTRRIVGISGLRLWSQRALSVSGTDICTSTKFNLAGVLFLSAEVQLSVNSFCTRFAKIVGLIASGEFQVGHANPLLLCSG